jgi:hypothetical protein
VTLSESESREIKIGIAVAVLGAFIVSTVGGAMGVYIGYRLLEQRMATVERLVEQHGIAIDSNRRESEIQLSKIAADVSYIRGKLENK